VRFGNHRAVRAAVFLCLLPACARSEPRPPVIVLGADGLEWSVAEVLLKEGKMPNLQRLLDEGVGGRLATMVPTFSPALWTTIATGREPRDHGIPFFSETDAQGKPKVNGLPYTSESRKVPALWNLADAAGRSVTSVGWWVSWPAEHLRHGRIVASYAAQAQGALLWKAGVWTGGLPELTWPESLADPVATRLKEGGPEGEIVRRHIQRYGAFPKERIANESERKRVRQREINYLSTAASDRTHQQIFCDLLKQEVSDLNLMYFGSTDVVGHFFWKYHEPGAYSFTIPQEQLDHFGSYVRKSYEDLDAWIGEILALLPAERVIILLADHGMRAYYTDNPSSLQSGHHQEGEPGVFVLSGSGVERRGLLPDEAGPLGSILEVAPFVCDLIGIEALTEMDPNRLRGLMSAAWRTAHAEAARKPSPAFRAALPPREPIADASEVFIEQFIALGYAGVGGATDPEAPPAPDSEPK
jgi:hypothetical protein